MGKETKSEKQIIAEKYLHLVSDSIAKTPESRGLSKCPCPNSKTCSLYGNCMLCTAFHAGKGQLPYCER